MTSSQDNSAISKMPETIRKEWDWDRNDKLGFYPDQITYGSNKKVYWKCKKCGQSYLASVKNKFNGNGCPVCVNKVAIAGYNDLESHYPDIAKELHSTKNADLKASEIPYGSDKKVWWKCSKCEHEWEARISTRTKAGAGCPKCAAKKVSESRLKLAKGESLAEHKEYLAILKEWNVEKNLPITPSDVRWSSVKKVWWKCSECGNEWVTDVSHRVNGRGCPVCAINNLKIIKSIPKKGRSISENSTKLTSEWFYEKNGEKTPKTVAIASNKKFFWKCSECQTIYSASPAERITGHKNCPHCNSSSGEKRVKDVLDMAGVKYQTEYAFKDCKDTSTLPFDFAILKKNKPVAIIEFDGVQHSRPVDFAGRGEEWAKQQYSLTRKHDKIKNNYCKKKNIPLLRIPYTDYGKVEVKINAFLQKQKCLKCN